jgi:hypothetical protein
VLHRLAAVAAFAGQQCPPGRDERGNERLEKPLERDTAVGLTGHEGAVDGGERETRELAGDRAQRIVAERRRDLCPQQLERMVAHPADNGLYLPVARGRRLHGEADQQAQEVRMPLKRANGGRRYCGQVPCRTPGRPGRLGQIEVGEEAIGGEPVAQQNLPQIRLEPLLKARAEDLSPGRIRFGHELTGLEQDGAGVRATIRDHASGRHYVVRCRYLLGADGGRRVASLVGVGYEGVGVVTQTATLHVSADFSPWARDPDVLIRWIYSP